MTLNEYYNNSSWTQNMTLLIPDEYLGTDGLAYFSTLLTNKFKSLSVTYGSALLNYDPSICDEILNSILNENITKIIIFISRVNNLASTYSTTENISDDSGYAGFDKDNQDGVFQNKLITRNLNDPKIQMELIKDEISNIPDYIMSYYVSRIINSIYDGYSDL